ncbi:glycosyl hydrolase [Caulobacter rhizosphaerae]|uniref:glycosyl hydrolase n=1 Tax=Caulobacter rhizosphaerae TaxID=2010972 RepID=UPI0013D1E4E7|nr:glycosyl hydrolase [Caulobacter rhizosphaerae]GGL35129.1 hypothetical protein GCM10010983_35250 [Caulobacter rhizosphaerae]
MPRPLLPFRASSPTRRARFDRASALVISGLLLWPALAQAQTASDDLAGGFVRPPQAAKPRLWWHWMEGNVTAEGARLDLDWMQRIGVGGVHVFSGGGFGEPKLVDQPLPFMSAGWQEVFRQSVQSANAAKMEVGIAGSPGWSQTGGVFVPPADGMKKYVWSETRLVGGRAPQATLAGPPIAVGPFQGVAGKSAAKQLTGPIYADALVVAFPTSSLEDSAATPRLSANDPAADLSRLARPTERAAASLPLSPDGAAWVEAGFDKPTLLSAVAVATGNGVNVEVQAADLTGAWRVLTHQTLVAPSGVEHPAPQQTLAFPATVAQRFRVVFSLLAPPPPLPGLPPSLARVPPRPKAITLDTLAFFASPRVNRFEAKAGFQTSIEADAVPTPALTRGGAIAAAQVMDLSSKLSPDGRLDWTPPKGNWTVLRFGWTLTGQTNGPAEAAATGLEVDKLDPAAVGRYAETYLGLYDQASGGRLGPSGVDALITDSWEAGFQNWTPGLLDEFKRRRGYDPVPFAPVLAGRVVDSAAASERFLWDYRLTLKELLADAHHGVLAKAAHQRGMTYYTEASGDNPRVLGDGMALKARSDIPTAEFWYRDFASGPGQMSLRADLQEAASAAHVYGKPLAAAESLTVAAGQDPWSFSPAMLKPVADRIFALGINRILLHESRQQPLIDAKPGLTLAIFGQYFNRNETWAEDAAPWLTYLARTSYLLQQGRYVADVAYFYGEDRTLTELFRRKANTDVPPGYAYDYVNREALLTLLSVKDGRVVTPSGMSYRVLYAPPTVDRMTAPALQKIRDLVLSGAVLVAPKPIGGLGLASNDAQIAALAREIWGEAAIGPAGRALGAGRVYASLDQALAGEKIAPDQRLSGAPDAELLSLHRRTDDADIYFVSNQKDRAEDVRAFFRVEGKAPEIWRATNASMAPASYVARDGGTETSLRLEAGEAAFVVFRKATALKSFQAPARAETLVAQAKGPWSLTFGPGLAAPPPTTVTTLASWTQAPDAATKYYSGSATYRTRLEVPKVAARSGQRLYLDLGQVRELASISVNGKAVGVAWAPPYRLDVTDMVRPGRNEIAVRVVNLWRNRLIGDKQPGAKPVTVAPMAFYGADAPLFDSGLLGPVRLVSEINGPHPLKP